jgi:hypothetical protein
LPKPTESPGPSLQESQCASAPGFCPMAAAGANCELQVG